ncbi:MAG: peptide chain release factor N(5)-glutamine methyltransferase [Gammaproteobacteria bacterium]|nr:peptide chain release factor N(5)-glutamine methyltransferase [Gammaproteobacteria bacterium]
MTESLFTIDEILQIGTRELSNSDSPRLDSEILLLKVLNDSSISLTAPPMVYTKTWLLTWPEKILAKEHVQRFKQYLGLRSEGMPIAYITGSKDFWSFTLEVSTETLIPRPETELLVECALEKIPTHGVQNILDLGTGSGAIALAIASERDNASVQATDISLKALNIAKKNATKLKLKNISFYQSHWFDSVKTQQFDVIASNPPYIAENDPYLEDNVRHYEPLIALLSNDNGLADIKEIIERSHDYLKPNGWLLFEHGFEQDSEIRALLKQQKFNNISTLSDLSQLPRVTIAQHTQIV